VNKINLKTVKENRNKWWMKMHFLFSLVIVSQIYSFHHQVEHLTDYNDKECVQCIVSSDYFGMVADEISLNTILPDTIFSIKLGKSTSTHPPVFYSSRAPPKVI